MKKLLFILPIIFIGCATATTQSKLERNEKCSDIEEVEVFQTLNDGALAFVCEHESYADLCLGMTVAIRKEVGEDLWDKKHIKVTKGKCFAYEGVYKYTNSAGMDKTVPIIRLRYAYPPASEKEVLERLDEARAEVYHECLYEANAEFKNERDNNIKKCECFADFTIGKFVDTLSSENGAEVINTEQFAKNLMTEAEKKCGKIPSKMKL